MSLHALFINELQEMGCSIYPQLRTMSERNLNKIVREVRHAKDNGYKPEHIDTLIATFIEQFEIEDKRELKTFIVECSETVYYSIEIEAHNAKQAEEILFSCEHEYGAMKGNPIEYDAYDGGNFEIDRVYLANAELYADSEE